MNDSPKVELVVTSAVGLEPGKVYVIEANVSVLDQFMMDELQRALHHTLRPAGIQYVVVFTATGKALRIVEPEPKDAPRERTDPDNR